VVAACAAIVLATLFVRIAAVLVLLGVAAFTFSYLQTGVMGPLYGTRASCVSREQSYRELLRLIEEFRSDSPVLSQTWVWDGPTGARTFGPDCQFDLSHLRRSADSIGMSNLGPTTAHPSQITDKYMIHVADGALVVAMVQHDNDADGLVDRFAANGKTLTLARRQTTNLGKIPVVVLVYRVKKAM
jgi:hypothetical protein